MGYSLGRKAGKSRNAYSGYTRSRAWGWRRQRWFRDVRRKGFEPACQVCSRTLEANGTLDLHHLSYDGVSQNADGQWIAKEQDNDLMALCRDHHEQLHQHLDDRRRDYWGWSRARASIVIITRMRRNHQPVTDTGTGRDEDKP